METQQGWVKLHRKIYSNPWSRDPEWFAVWCFLLAHVAWEPTDVIFEGKRVTIQAGQMTTDRRTIAKQTGVSSSKVQRVLACLESEQQIEQQMTPRCRLITVKNWTQYQQSEPQSEPQMNRKRTTTEPQLNHIKEFQEDKEIKKERREGDETSPPTPKETMQNFCEMVKLKNDQYFLFIQKISQTKKLPPEKVRAEVDKFVNYWREKNPSGTKERWQMQKVFEIQRRLGTWFSRASNYGGFQEKKQGITIIS